MFPSLTQNNRRDHRLGDAVLPCERRLIFGRSTDSANVILSQFRGRISATCDRGRVLPSPMPIPPHRGFRISPSPVAVARCHTALARSITQIVGIGSEEEMVQPYTGWVVASVADEQSRMDRTMRHLPGVPMRSNATTVNGVAPIAVFIAPTRPGPTVVPGSSVNFAPEDGHRINTATRVATYLGAESAQAESKPRRIREKRGAAELARTSGRIFAHREPHSPGARPRPLCHQRRGLVASILPYRAVSAL